MHLRGPARPPRGHLKSSNVEEVWTVAAELTRSRASSAKIRRELTGPKEPNRYLDDNYFNRGRIYNARMRLNVSDRVVGDNSGEPEVVAASGGGKKAADNANWINKYQHSDHHFDRMVRTIVDYEATTGEKFPETFKNTTSAIPYLVYVQQAKVQSDSPSLSRKTVDGSTNNYIKMPIQSRRPPLGPNNGVRLSSLYVPNSLMTSLPVHEHLSASSYSTYSGLPSSAHARRASMSSDAPRYGRVSGNASSHVPEYQPSSLDNFRRASFSDAASATGNYRPDAAYRPRATSDVGRRSIDRSLSDYEYQVSGGRRMSMSRGPAGAHSRSASRERSIPLATPSTPKMSDARKKIWSVLNKTSSGGESENYLPY